MLKWCIIGSGDVKWISGNSDGWVGIGTTTPTALLDVDGDVNITGVATIPQLDVNNIGIEDIKITAGLATDFAITNLVNSVGFSEMKFYWYEDISTNLPKLKEL